MYLLLFLICIGFYMINMAVEHVYPFGSRSFLYQDACDQYPGILKIFLEWLHSGDKGSFIWERGLGIDIVLNMFYYCMSPFNIIAIVLGPDQSIMPGSGRTVLFQAFKDSQICGKGIVREIYNCNFHDVRTPVCVKQLCGGI